MPTSHRLRNLLPLTLLLAGQAHAGAVLLAPLLVGKGAVPDKAADITSLMASELEFMAGIDEVIELSPAPAQLTSSCLDSTACLGSLAEANNADAMVAGILERSGTDYVIDVLYYETEVNRVLRRKRFMISSEASSLLDQVSPIMVEMVTGATPKATQAQSQMQDVEFDDLSDDDAPPPEPPPEPPPVRTTTPPPPAPVEETFDPNAFSFGADPNAITFGDAASTITFGDDEDVPPPEPPPVASYRDDEDEDDIPVTPTRRYEDEEEDDEPAEPIRRDDPPARTSTASSSSRSSSTTKRSKGDLDELRRVSLAARGGYANYGAVPKETNPESPRYDAAFTGFHFATIGAEVGVRLVSGLTFMVGVDVNMVRRALPPDQVPEGAKPFETNYIFPVNAGLIYKINLGRVRPYIGADAVFSHIRTACLDVEVGACEDLADPELATTLVRDVDYVVRQNWAVGGRGRLGLDVMVNPHVGFNVDAALGYWSSRDWPNVDPRQPTGGFYPKISGGMTFAF
jgi:hypothetical protein